METRRLFTALLAAMAVFYLWMFVSRLIWPAPPPGTEPPGTASAPATATAPVPGAPATQPAPTPGTAPAALQPATGQAIVVGGEDETPIVLGNARADSAYPMALAIMPQGASVAEVAVRGHYETVAREKPYTMLKPVPLGDPDGPVARSFVTRIRFENLKLDADLRDVIWNRVQVSPERVVLRVDLFTPDNQPLARLTKTFELLPQSPEDQTCDLSLSLAIGNLSGHPFEAILTQQGPIGFTSELLRGEDRAVVSALWQEGGVDTTQYQRNSVFKRSKKYEIGSDDESSRIAWAAEGNKYFATIMAPAGRTGPGGEAHFARLEAVCLTDIKDELDRERQDLTFQFITRPMTVPAGQATDVAFECYLGPKSKPAFQDVPAYSQRQYYAVITSSYLWCAITPIVDFMIWLLNAFHAIPPYNYGLSIVVLVLVVRAALHPITKKSQVNMMRMQKRTAELQPRMKAAKEKYANDKVKLNQAIMEIYREEGINPASNLLTCLPLGLQIPIWGALWTALAYTIEMRHAPLDGWWIKDLTQPDALIPFAGAGIRIPIISLITNGPIKSLNLLPILLGVTQVLQARFMPRGNPSAQSSGNPDQLEQQRKMMMFMSVFFIFILYNAPSGLTLYIMASNIFGIIEQWRIRKHLAEEDAKPAKKPAPDKRPSRPAPRRDDRQPQPKSWFFKSLDRLQKHAEEAKRIESPRKKGNGKPR